MIFLNYNISIVIQSFGCGIYIDICKDDIFFSLRILIAHRLRLKILLVIISAGIVLITSALTPVASSVVNTIVLVIRLMLSATEPIKIAAYPIKKGMVMDFMVNLYVDLSNGF